MYYKSKLNNRQHKNPKYHHNREIGERKRYISDVILRAVITGIFIFSLLLNVVLIAVIVIIGINQKSKISYLAKGATYTKEYIKGDASYSRSFVIIDINGIISEAKPEGFYNFNVRESMVDGIKNRLKLVEKDPSIKGVILLINSPGGTVTASDMIYHEIENFKERCSIPVISYIKDVGASGAYYVASASDYIISYPTAITGSIGVIMYNFNFKNLMEKYGVKYVVIKSGKHKDLMSPFKEIDPSEIKWMQGIVDELLDRFIEVVKVSRKNLTLKQIKSLADGRVYTAKMAQRLGLIDEVGYFDDALKYLEKITNVSSYSVFRYVKRRQFGGLLNIIARANNFGGYKGYLPLQINKIGNKNGIKLYYLMDSGYSSGLNIELY